MSTSPANRTIQLPERCRVSLLELFQKAKIAQREYDIAAGHVLAAFGLNPADANHVNLDTGVITPAEPPKTEE